LNALVIRGSGSIDLAIDAAVVKQRLANPET